MSKASNPKKHLLYNDGPNVSTSSNCDTTTHHEPQIFTSTPIHDRNSTFQAHFHLASIFATRNGGKPTSLAQITKTAQNHPSFTDASHRIVAWRKRSAQTTLSATTSTTSSATPAKVVYSVNSDDDGEKYAGKRLEKVLTEMDVEGVLVCARWYGGVLLGPVRFTHIENVAREAVRMWRDSLGGGDGAGKRAKLDGSDIDPLKDSVDDPAARAKLARQLNERDSSIAVLRELLAEKTNPKPKASGATDERLESSQAPSSAASPAKKIDYSEMPLARLKQLEKARDATIAFILKQLDKVEEEEQAKELETIAALMDDAAGGDG